MAAVDLDAALSADSSMSAALNLAAALSATLSADSSVSATCVKIQAITCSMSANSALSVTAMDVMYTPPPNVPAPLPVPAVVPLRIVPNPPNPPSTVVSSRPRTRRSFE